MFPYDPLLLSAVAKPVATIPDVLQTMQEIAATCTDGDGLKWFNWLYQQVTEAVFKRVSGGGFVDAAWLTELDVQFARLYFAAISSSLSGKATPGCWEALFERRNQTSIARIQFAIAGINAHINHDLALAIVGTCQATGTVPQHGTANYTDYTALNTTLDTLIDVAKQTLLVRLLGDPLPPVSYVEDTLAAWKVQAAREAAWLNSELLWHLNDTPLLADGFLKTLDNLTSVAGKTLLVPVPL